MVKVDKAIKDGLNVSSQSGKQVVLLTSSIISPSTSQVLKAFIKKYNKACYLRCFIGIWDVRC